MGLSHKKKRIKQKAPLEEERKRGGRKKKERKN
jgi:hypothetical protein